MIDIYAYTVKLPPGINEMVAPCADGFTVYLSDRLSPEKRIEAYEHALNHIKGNDFEKSDVSRIEEKAHWQRLRGQNKGISPSG